eukprot:XP_001698293.1 predicted protein [Chlamydomonas reinhardtii]
MAAALVGDIAAEFGGQQGGFPCIVNVWPSARGFASADAVGLLDHVASGDAQPGAAECAPAPAEQPKPKEAGNEAETPVRLVGALRSGALLYGGASGASGASSAGRSGSGSGSGDTGAVEDGDGVRGGFRGWWARLLRH